MATVRGVEGMPDLGRVSRDSDPLGIRSLLLRRHPRYLLFYGWFGDTIEILRGKRGVMDFLRLFPGGRLKPAPH